MRQRFFITAVIFFALFIGAILLLNQPQALTANFQAVKPGPTNSYDVDVLFSDTSLTSKAQTILPSLFGPQICTAYGDAFSPWASPYEPNVYTFEYRIAVPPDYAHNILRVELFDPDSINSSENEATVTRSALVQDSSAVNPSLGATTTKFCGIDTDIQNRRQDFSCIVPTDELNYLDDPLSINQINPYWFMRVDVNRGNYHTQAPHGDGSCQVPDAYTVGLNTQTRFDLYYFYLDAEENVTRAGLASYTGQTDDYRDQLIHLSGSPGDHNTDLYWISPGAESQGPDFDALYGTNHVPVDPGSSLDSFEIDLTVDVPNIVMDEDGVRYIHLDITALSGASRNSFAIWAGPPTYVDSVPANVNQRNVVVTNSPGAHESGGVAVAAVGRGVMTSLFDNQIDYPIDNLNADWAGEIVSATFFDVDSGSQPPVTFYIDTIPEEDWSLTFGAGGTDPDGVVVGDRCTFGSCNNQWITPTYQIQLPGNYANCTPDNPESPDCTPLHSGRLMMKADFGLSDSFTYEFQADEPETKPITDSCAAYPIALGLGARSISGDMTGAEPYPTNFQYPLVAPDYHQFTRHQPNVTLDDNTPEGTIFRYFLGTSHSSFSWLVWNQLITTPSDVVLSTSLRFPGNSTDFTDHGDPGFPHPNLGHVVRGYVEPGNSLDTKLHIDDFVAPSVAQLSNDITFGAVNDPMNEHITLSRVLTLPVFNSIEGGTGNIVVERFGLFRIAGYGGAGTASEWLLVEFMGWNDSCGQLSEPEPPATPTPDPTDTPEPTATPDPSETPEPPIINDAFLIHLPLMVNE